MTTTLFRVIGLDPYPDAQDILMELYKIYKLPSPKITRKDQMIIANEGLENSVSVTFGYVNLVDGNRIEGAYEPPRRIVWDSKTEKNRGAEQIIYICEGSLNGEDISKKITLTTRVE